MNDRPSYCSVLWDVGAWVDSHQHLKILPGAEFERMRWPLEHGSCFFEAGQTPSSTGTSPVSQEQVVWKRRKDFGFHADGKKNSESIAVVFPFLGALGGWTSAIICHLFLMFTTGFWPISKLWTPGIAINLEWSHMFFFFSMGSCLKVTIIIRLP